MQSTRRVIRKALVEVIESKTAAPGERVKACKLLLKVALAPKGKPRGRPFSSIRASVQNKLLQRKVCFGPVRRTLHSKSR